MWPLPVISAMWLDAFVIDENTILTSIVSKRNLSKMRFLLKLNLVSLSSAKLGKK